MDALNRKKVLLLGSTGSIGCQVVDVAKRHPDKIEIVGLAAGKRVGVLARQAKELGVHCVSVGDELAAESPDGVALAQYALSADDGFFGIGSQGVIDLIDACDADVVVNSLVGAAGVRASYEALLRGKRLALANKESLVVAGDLIMPQVARVSKQALSSGCAKYDEAHFKSDAPAEIDSKSHGKNKSLFNPSGYLMPIDSEHGAIFQCLLGERMDEVCKLWVTASGGPFRGWSRAELEKVTCEQALAHPTWNMGPKITIDSSTLMNKGLEVIEAHHLFDMPYDKIEVVVQPQSAIHSMVEFSDGSVKAHLGTTDMRIPIQFALSYPDRWDAPVAPLDFRTLGSLDFMAPDTETFHCLALARQAGIEGGTLPCAMNAANEVAVAAFLSGECGFLDIADCVEHVMDSHANAKVESIDQLLAVDKNSRDCASSYIVHLRNR